MLSSNPDVFTSGRPKTLRIRTKLDVKALEKVQGSSAEILFLYTPLNYFVALCMSASTSISRSHEPGLDASFLGG